MLRTRHIIGTALALPAIALIAAGCGSSDGGSVATASSPASAGGHSALKVATKAKVGRVLVDAQGRTLYRYTPDHGSKSTCTGACAKLWPPAVAPGAGSPKAGGVKGTVATTTRAGGTRQLTFDGKPLYRFSQDTSTADANGQGVDHIWFVIPAQGSGSAPASSAPTTTSSKPKGGYGY